jgi:hypothetical protein
MAKSDTNNVVEPQVLTSKTLFKADGRGEDAVKTSFEINCFPVGTGQTFITNAVEGLGIGFVVRAVSQVLSIDARAAFMKELDMATWLPNADGTASSGDGYGPTRRDLKKKGVPADVIEAIIENAKANANKE